MSFIISQRDWEWVREAKRDRVSKKQQQQQKTNNNYESYICKSRSFHNTKKNISFAWNVSNSFMFSLLLFFSSSLSDFSFLRSIKTVLFWNERKKKSIISFFEREKTTTILNLNNLSNNFSNWINRREKIETKKMARNHQNSLFKFLVERCIELKFLCEFNYEPKLTFFFLLFSRIKHVSTFFVSKMCEKDTGGCFYFQHIFRQNRSHTQNCERDNYFQRNALVKNFRLCNSLVLTLKGYNKEICWLSTNISNIRFVSFFFSVYRHSH